jgi:hypothetical protein
MTTTSATTATTSADATGGESTTGADGCGDGVPESGVFCFERIDAPEVEESGTMAATDFDGDGVADLIVGSCSASRSPYDFCVFRWDGVGLKLLAASGTQPSPGLGYCGFPLLRLQPDRGEQLSTCANQAIRIHALVDGAIETQSEEPLPEGPFYTPRPVIGIDVDGDGIDEILAQDYVDSDDAWDTPLLLRRGVDGWTFFGDPMPFGSSNSTMYPVAAGDLDRDGRTDLTLEDSGYVDASTPGHEHYDPELHQLVVVRSDGGTLTEHSRFPAGTWPTTVQLADLDGDSRLDLVVRGTDRVGMAHGVGDGTFTDVELLNLAGYDWDGDALFGGARTADLDGDGDPELVLAVGVGNRTHGDVVIIDDPLASADQTTIATEIAKGSPEHDRQLLAEDFTGDGIADIAVSSNVDGIDRLSLFVARP